MPETKIQPFKNEHIELALELWRRVEHIGLSAADDHASLARFLDRNPGFSQVAVHAGDLIGAVLCGHDGRRGYIHHLAVDPQHRLAGVGRALLERCLERLRRAEIQKCHAFVFQGNPFGDLFWQPEGWELRGELLVYSRHLK
jgi:ribosomal protein S18 acetylase RimI-like enzyme